MDIRDSRSSRDRSISLEDDDGEQSEENVPKSARSRSAR